MFRATIKNGRMVFGSPVARSKFVEWAAGHEGAHIVIEQEKHGRSLSQNAYYWVFLGVIERETGQNADDVHEWAKRKFLPPKFITVNGEEIKIPSSTTTLSKIDFGEYLDKIAAETGIPLPDPEAAGYISNH